MSLSFQEWVAIFSPLSSVFLSRDPIRQCHRELTAPVTSPTAVTFAERSLFGDGLKVARFTLPIARNLDIISDC